MFSWRFSGAQRMQWGGGFFRVGAGALSLAKGFLARGAPRVPGLNWRFCVSSSRPPMAAAGNSGPPGATSGHFARAQFSRGFSKKRKEKGGFKVSTMGTRVSVGCHGGRGSFGAFGAWRGRCFGQVRRGWYLLLNKFEAKKGAFSTFSAVFQGGFGGALS